MGAPLYYPKIGHVFTQKLKEALNSQVQIQEMDDHINNQAFGQAAAEIMDRIVWRKSGSVRQDILACNFSGEI